MIKESKESMRISVHADRVHAGQSPGGIIHADRSPGGRVQADQNLVDQESNRNRIPGGEDLFHKEKRDFLV